MRDIKEYLLAFKIGKQKEKEEKKRLAIEKNKAYQKEYRLKKKEEREKQKKLLQLKEALQKVDEIINENNKQTFQTITIKIFNNPLIERDWNEDDLYHTREELENAEKEMQEEGKINWVIWDKIVESTKNKIFLKKVR